MSRLVVAAFYLSLFLTGQVLAQTPPGVSSPAPDPAFVQNAIAALQQQRNAALDQVAEARAQLAVAQGQLASAKKELEELKAKSAPKEEPAK